MSVRFAWVTDIPTPYRNHLYERMAAILPGMGIELIIHFMAMQDYRRPWRFAPDELKYPWKVHRTPVPALASRSYHVNPTLLAALGRGEADVVMIGGWASPTHVVAPFVMPRRVVKILGCESHPGSVGRVHSVARAVKRMIVHRYDAYLVPGLRSRELLISLDQDAARKPYVILPNVIDAGLFRDGVAALRGQRPALRAALGIAADVQLWLCPARLLTVKGLLEFVPLLQGLRGVVLLIAGDGELRPDLEAAVARDGLPVRLLGHQPVERMVELYAAADVFVLPSLADASPLSAVEAAAAGLPLLMSNRCGNSDDLVVEDGNGWIYDVTGGAARRALLERVAATPRAKLESMGRRSLETYQRHFDTDACVRTLGEFIVAQAVARIR